MGKPEILIPRRRLFGLLFCTGTGLLLGASKADAMWNVMEALKGIDAPSSSGGHEVPPSLRGVIGPKGDAYRKFLTGLGLRRMSVEDIMATHSKAHGNIHNTLPPRQIWGNIDFTLRMIDKLAGRMGEPGVEVLSVYRSPAYNATCPGARSNSYHIKNNATDFRFDSSPRKVAKAARDMRKQGLFKGGIGRYPNFVHVDTRGQNADW